MLFQQIESMTKNAHRLLLSDDLPESKEKCEQRVSSEIDKGYFNSYSHFAIHHEMLTVLKFN